MTLQMPFSLLVAIGDVSNKVFHPATAWVSTEEILRIWPEFGQAASQTHFRAVAALQVSNDPNVPGGTTEIGTALTADGKNWGVNFDPASALANFRFVRIGWMVWVNAGGSPPLFGRCGGHVALTQAPG